MNKTLVNRLAELEARRPGRVIVAYAAGVDLSERPALTPAEAEAMARPQDTVIIIAYSEAPANEH